MSCFVFAYVLAGVVWASFTSDASCVWDRSRQAMAGSICCFAPLTFHELLKKLKHRSKHGYVVYRRSKQDHVTWEEKRHRVEEMCVGLGRPLAVPAVLLLLLSWADPVFEPSF